MFFFLDDNEMNNIKSKSIRLPCRSTIIHLSNYNTPPASRFPEKMIEGDRDQGSKNKVVWLKVWFFMEETRIFLGKEQVAPPIFFSV